ncbi:hypothetical protein [Cysteiniphilum litorale]|uniref:hypothetical protein n=1 Tax=Cysteiniphilum litorale TaxID=2056700 RepID=UPI003F881B07
MDKNEILQKFYQISVAEYSIYENPKVKDGVCVNTGEDPLRYEIGLLAQQLDFLFPHLTAYVNGQNDNDGIKVNYPMLIPIMVLAIHEQQNQIDELKKLLHR